MSNQTQPYPILFTIRYTITIPLFRPLLLPLKSPSPNYIRHNLTSPPLTERL